jgi:hypothetical protein
MPRGSHSFKVQLKIVYPPVLVLFAGIVMFSRIEKTFMDTV